MHTRPYKFVSGASNLTKHGFHLIPIFTPVFNFLDSSQCKFEFILRNTWAGEQITFTNDWANGCDETFTIYFIVSELGPSIYVSVTRPPFNMGMTSSNRMSAPLNSGKSVSVALKEREDGGQCIYVIEMSIDPEGKLRWPCGI